jgi:hypothetical protein
MREHSKQYIYCLKHLEGVVNPCTIYNLNLVFQPLQCKG